MILIKVPELHATVWSYRDMAHVTHEGKKKVIITGSMNFHNYGLLKRKMNRFTFFFDDKVVVCVRGLKEWDAGLGRYSGAEVLGERWGHAHKYLVMIFHPPDDRGKKLRERDEEIVRFADYMAVFVNGYMDNDLKEFVKLAKRNGVKTKIVRDDDD